MVLRIDSVVIPLDILFIRYTEGLPYVTRLAGTTVCYANPRDKKFTTHSLNSVTLLLPFHPDHFPTKFEYLLKRFLRVFTVKID